MSLPQRLTDSVHSQNSRSIANSFEDPEWYLKGYTTNIRIRVETVVTLLAGLNPHHILDVGCGDGSLSLPLLQKASHVTYLDQSRAMLEKVKARVTGSPCQDISYIAAGFMDAALPTAYFDLIICVGVLAYVDDKEAFLQKLSSLLSANGLLILECTDAAHLLSRADKIYQGATHLFRSKRFETYQHTSNDVIRAAATRNLRLAQTFRYAYSFPLFSRMLSASLLYRVIRAFFGTVTNNRRSYLGNQSILLLVRTPNT